MHESNAHHRHPNKIPATPGVKLRVRTADRLRRARDLDATINELDDTIRFINGSPPNVPNELEEHSKDERVALLLRKAGVFLQQSRFKDAKLCCDDALQIGIGVPSAKCYAYRAASYLGQNKLSQAASECQIALNLAPNLHIARYWLASARFLMEDWRACVRECALLLQANPSDANAWSMRCESKRRLGLWKSLVKDCDVYLKVAKGGNTAKCWCARAEALLNLNRMAECEISCSNCINLDPSIMAAFQIRGEARYQQQKYKQSVADFHKYGELDREKRKVPFVAPFYAIWNRNRDRPW
jgi:tetratricopeptide (TPR) repeat protein